ncbi:MAG TPA: AbrB/MazE/SpoVT family DNA-binding domain-containing protein [Acidimicrobiales bacterium]|nr:AbrB/MazE/SpoVT family DNA-binding domain-containing protein [Acidimicrobiales bacterium]
MESSGLPRRIDHLGRIVVPVELRRMLGINPGDELDVAVKNGSVTLTKIQQGCVFCGRDEDVQTFRERLVCVPCSQDLGSRFGTPSL